MRTLGEGIGIEMTAKLSAAEPKSGIPETITTAVASDRVNFKDLELIYRIDGLAFNEVNKFVQTIMAAGYTIQGNDEETKSYIINFLDSIGNVGEETTWDELLTEQFRDLAIFGNSYIELVPNKSDTEIVDLKRIDPKRMDLAKDFQKNIVVDQFGRPVGYILKLPYGQFAIQKDPVPEKVSKIGINTKFLVAERIAHFKLYTFGDGYIGIGLLEASYKSIVRKLNIEEAHANFIYNTGFSPRIGYAGDINHEPTQQAVDALLSQIKDLNYKQNLATPYYNKIELLEPKKTESLESSIKYLQSQQIACSGMPQALVTGSGEETNRQTLTNQQIFFEYGLMDITNRICSSIRKQIFKRVIEKKFGKNRDIPRIVWNRISEAELNEKAERIINYIEKGAIDPKDPALKDYIRDTENIKLK